jgi:hypothetical protein
MEQKKFGLRSIFLPLAMIIIISSCGGGGGGGSGDELDIYPIPTVLLSANVNSIETNTSFSLTWSSTNATSCLASGDWSDFIGLSGSKSIVETSSGTKTYNIECTGKGGTASATVNISITDPIEPTVTLSASTTSVTINSSFTLTWSSTNATSCSASGDWSNSIDTSGDQSITETEPGSKTYNILCSGDGGNATDSVVVNVNSEESNTAFNGYAIDGYISGANIFIDQNFNFTLDDGEFSSVTASDGSFVIETNDETIFKCLKKRPIVADVPEGAFDSTLGGVTEAYQMILPSVDDAGNSNIIISPFTSLFAEAIIKGKNNSDLTEDLSVEEGCQIEGDNVAENISTAILELRNTIETNFGITYEALLGDFIDNATDEKVTEEVAQKIAAFFPYYKLISDTISDELSEKYNKEVIPNLSLSQRALDAIFLNEEFDKLPLEFYSVYTTNPNNEGFYNVDEISASGAKVTSEGVIERYLCTLSDAAECLIDDFSLNAIGNASKEFNRQVNINNDNFTVDGVEGNITIYGSERRGVRGENSSPESYCESEEFINFVGPQDSLGLQMEYRYGFGRGVNNINDCSFLTNYGPSLGLRIEKQGRGINFPNTAPTWAVQFNVLNNAVSNLTKSKVYNIIDDENLNPESLIQEVAQIPVKLTQIDDMRKLLSYGDSAFYYYSPNTSPDYEGGETFDTYQIQISSVPRDDQYQERSYNGSSATESEPIFGQAARDKIYQILKESKYNYDNFVGDSPPQSRVLFEYESEGILFRDRYSDIDRDYYIYPRFNSDTGWIDASLVGSEILKSSIDAFIDGDDLNGSSFYFGINTDGPFTSTQEFNLKIYNNDSYDNQSEYLELSLELKIETLESGNIEISWLNGSSIDFSFIDNGITISKNIVNNNNTKVMSIPKGSYVFEDFAFLKSLLDQVRDNFSSLELGLLKDFFFSNGQYSYKIDLGNYTLLDDFDGTSSIIAGTFGVSDTPSNSIYGYYKRFNEGDDVDICFKTAWNAETDITFTINPIFEDKPGFISSTEAIFNKTNLIINAGENTVCTYFQSPIDDALREKQEFLMYEIIDTNGGLSGRNIPIRLTVEDWGS